MRAGEGKEGAPGQKNFLRDVISLVDLSKDTLGPYLNTEFNLAAAQGDGAAHTSSLHTAPQPLDVQVTKAAVGGAVKGAMTSLIDCILEQLKSCYNSCCDCCDADEAD
ncbi:hypothetical protein ACP70R_045613 [Stipagrostis hirtigluma subsp. patula]